MNQPKSHPSSVSLDHAVPLCTCNDCIYSETPCRNDCDAESECAGCREARIADSEAEFESRKAMGYE